MQPPYHFIPFAFSICMLLLLILLCLQNNAVPLTCIFVGQKTRHTEILDYIYLLCLISAICFRYSPSLSLWARRSTRCRQTSPSFSYSCRQDKESAAPERVAVADQLICRRPLETEAELEELNQALGSKKFAREMVRDKHLLFYS